MPWHKTAADRRRDARTYGDPVYRRNRAIVMRRANGRCECPGDCGAHEGPCGRRDRPLQCDHITPVTQGGGHEIGNLRGICDICHKKKSAGEGGGYRLGRPQPAEPPSIQRTRW